MRVLMCWSMIAAIVYFGASQACAESPIVAAWPQFRGFNSSGIADASSLPIEFGPEQNVVWSVELPPGVSSPCIWGNRIFLTSLEPETQSLQTLCLDRSNGQILWQQSAPTAQIEKVHEVSSPANATPVADEERVYVYFASFGLLCYDHQGNLVWQHSLPMPRGPFGSGTSPILVNELLILNHDLIMQRDAGDSYLLALNRRTGETVWKTKHDSSFTPYATPVHWHNNGKDRILLLSMSRLTAYELNDGSELWSVSDLPIQTVATPVIGDGRLYLCATGAFGEDVNTEELPAFDKIVATYDKNTDGLGIDEIPEDMLMINRHMSRSAGNSKLRDFIGSGDSNEDQKISKEEWDKFLQEMHEFTTRMPQGVYAIQLDDSVDGERIVWVDRKGVPEVPSLLFWAGRLYSVKNGGVFQCRDAATGKSEYVGRLRATGGYYASPVFGDGKIYTASDQGQVSVIKADDRLTILATNDFEEPIMASPALVGNTIYIRTLTRLYACSIK